MLAFIPCLTRSHALLHYRDGISRPPTPSVLAMLLLYNTCRSEEGSDQKFVVLHIHLLLCFRTILVLTTLQ